MTNSLPLVSVIIPAFNCADYIAEAIESVFVQTFQRFEIIVVDDGSTDETSEILQRYENRIRLVSQKNQGVATARNMGVNLAKGKLVAFLDADDVFFPEKLAKQVSLFEGSPELGMVISGWQVTTQGGEVVSQARLWKERPVLDLETAVLYKPARPSATMLRKAWFEKVKGFDAELSSAEDLDFLLRVMLAGARAEWLPEVQVSYRQHVGSLMTQGQQLLANTDLVMERFFVRAEVPIRVQQLKRKERYQSLSWLGAKLYFEGQPLAMESCLKQSLAYAEKAKTTVVFEWFQTFRGYAAEYGYKFESYQLTSSAAWQAVMALALPKNPSLQGSGKAVDSTEESAEKFGIKTGKEEKHVLLYSDDPGAGGILQCNHAIVCHLAQTGYKATHVHFQQETPLAKEEASLGIQAVDLGYSADSDFTRSLKDISGAKQLFETQSPDLIVFSDGWPFSNLAAKQAANDLGIPYVIVLGFIEPSCAEYDYQDGVNYHALVALQYNRAATVVAVSQENLKLLRILFDLPDSVGQVIYNGRPAEYFNKPDRENRRRLRAALGIPADGVVCFTSGRLEAVKGYQYQVEALRKLRQLPIWKKLYFVWAGPGTAHLSRSNEAELKEAVVQLGAVERVMFLGQCWEVAEWLDASDIFVLPSEAEGMPLAVMEAMAKGLPVVASAVSGIPEELGETGWLLSNPKVDHEGTISELAEVIERWARSTEIRQEVGQQCRRRAKELFHQDEMMKRYQAVFEACLWDNDHESEAERARFSARVEQMDQDACAVEGAFRYTSWVWKGWECYVRQDFEAMDEALEMAIPLDPMTASWPILRWGRLFSQFSKEQRIILKGEHLSRSKIWQELLQSF